MELNISNPPSFHSPLSLVYIDDTRTAPCTDDASSLMNLRVDCPNQHMLSLETCFPTYRDSIQTPLCSFLVQAPPLNRPCERCDLFGYDVNIGVCLRHSSAHQLHIQYISLLLAFRKPTSIVSSAFITPGCLSVRSLRTAFLASGRRDLFEPMSNVNMLHVELSS